MQVAYLILTHDQPRHLQRLINALQVKDAHFFVHVDLKADITKFDHFSSSDNVTFVQRIAVNHGGFTLTQAMIILMESALAVEEFDYFVFLSGKDYPIKGNEYIFRFLKTHYPMNFIHYGLISKADKRFFKTINEYHFVDLISSLPKPFKFFIKTFRVILNKLIRGRSFVREMVPYRGSQWLCLNNKTVNYIIDFLHSPNSKEYVKFFKYTWGSDEIFFHTIILNSIHASCCYHSNQNVEQNLEHKNVPSLNSFGTPLHYIDWSSDKENPAILCDQDFLPLKETNALFARKFCEKKSKTLLDKIDHLLLG
jgi:Core-2/I-Branching enzyme